MPARMFKISFRKMKRSYLLLFLTLSISVAALAVALLVVRSRKLQQMDKMLEEFGNYDIAFCDVTEETEQQILQDKRFSERGYIYDLGEATFAEGGGEVILGALRDKNTEKMFYINPVSGRYPEKKGEICVDRIALRCSGYTDKLGQEMILSRMDEDGEIIEDKYKLVGIVEMQKQDEGVTYSPRTYPEEMFSAENMKELDYPFAYISWEEAESRFACDKKHILTNVAADENSADVLESYLGMEGEEINKEAIDGLHINTERSFGREWVTACILGKQLEDGTVSDIVTRSMETGDVETDAYTKYFIPIFMVLIAVIASVGIFDAVRLSMEERRSVYGILLGLGMTATRILAYIVAEFLVLLILGVLLGWGVGILGYRGILWGISEIFHVALPSAMAMDAHYKPYIEMVTRSPWLWSAVLAGIVTLVGLFGVAVDIIAMTPIKLEHSAIRKRKRRKYIKGLYPILNRYVGRDSRVQRWIPYFLVCVIMSVSVFGFLFFGEKAVQDTADMTERIESARIKGMDYYMKHTDRVYSGNEQYMHQSGVTEEMYQELEENNAVDTVKGVIMNHSTALIFDKEEMLCNVLRPQLEYREPISNDTSAKLDAQSVMEYFRFLGIDTDEQEVFHVPTVGIRDEDMEHFEDFVVKGEIHPEKLQTGEEVLVVLTDESFASYFEPGKTIPLYDVTRPEKLDNSQEILLGQLPKEYKTEDKAYTVSADGETRKLWCNDTLKKCKTQVGAVLCIDGEEDSFFFDSGMGDIQVNLMAGKDAFQAWGLPNRNYTGVGVRLKNVDGSASFEQLWMRTLQQAGYMDSIDAYSILRERERTSQQIMAIFYAVFAVLLLIGMICIGNSIAMRIYRMGEEQRILHHLGMTRGRLLLMYVRRYSGIGLIGACFSLLPVAAYSLLVRYAMQLRQEAEKKDAVDALFIQKPWIENIPAYDMLDGKLIAVAIVAGIAAAVILCLLVLLQYGRMGRVLEFGEKEE